VRLWQADGEGAGRVGELRASLAAKTETDAEWVRRRLKEEADVDQDD
jgi:hypothetical protein